jgi:hypothetical protein
LRCSDDLEECRADDDKKEKADDQRTQRVLLLLAVSDGAGLNLKQKTDRIGQRDDSDRSSALSVCIPSVVVSAYLPPLVDVRLELLVTELSRNLLVGSLHVQDNKRRPFQSQPIRETKTKSETAQRGALWTHRPSPPSFLFPRVCSHHFCPGV